MRIQLFLGSAGSNSGGPERYEVELVRALAKLDQRSEFHIVSLFKRAPEVIGVAQDNVTYTALSPQVRTASMLTHLPWLTLKHRSDLWHATYVPPVFLHPTYIFTLVCSSMFEHPEYYPPAIRMRLSFLMGLALRKSGLIVCISEHIRDFIKDKFRIADDRLAVTHLGVNPSFRPLPAEECRSFLAERYGLSTPFLLFSGRWEPRKNLVRIVEAFARFKRESKTDFKLVLTGAKTWASREVDALIAKHRLADDVLDLGKSPVDELPMLYAGATALVFPSLWEGFGLPIVEAMAAGTPVITSNNSSMKEIARDAAILVDPLSTDEIAEAMANITRDEQVRNQLRSKGLVRAQDFTWERTARQTLDIYENFRKGD